MGLGGYLYTGSGTATVERCSLVSAGNGSRQSGAIFGHFSEAMAQAAAMGIRRKWHRSSADVAAIDHWN